MRDVKVTKILIVVRVLGESPSFGDKADGIKLLFVLTLAGIVQQR